MKWQYFGYGVLLCAVIALGIRFFIRKPEVKQKQEITTEIKKEVTISKYIPLKYGALDEAFVKKYKDNVVFSSVGVTFSGSEKDYQVFEKIIADLDKPLKEYLIDVLVLSVDVSNSHKTGLSVFMDTLKPYSERSALSIDPAGNFLLSSDIGQIIAVLENVSSKIKIEGRSQISVMQGHPAEITSGERRAVLSSTQSEGTTVNKAYSYVDIGLGLNVELLTGSNENYAQLKIKQNSDNVTGFSKIGSDEIPVISQRHLETACGVGLQETVVLGGLSQERISEQVSNIPFLSSLPFLGRLFSSVVKEKIKNDLIIVLRPILSRQDRLKEVQKRFGEFQEIRKSLQFEK